MDQTKELTGESYNQELFDTAANGGETITGAQLKSIYTNHLATITSLPAKTREIQNHHFDSTKWNGFTFRDDDIVVATAYKSGTTWMQNIVSKLTYQCRDTPENINDLCPWFDLRVPPLEVQLPMLEAMTDRRQLKSHLPLDALVFSPKAKYLYVGRDGRDCFMSLFNHYKNGNDLWYEIMNDSPGLVGEPLPRFESLGLDEQALFNEWISKGQGIEGETDGYPFWSLFDNVRTWWEMRKQPNVLFIHFQDMLDDLGAAIREIAAFLDIPIDETNFDAMVESLKFSSMKKDEKAMVPLGGAIFHGGKATFINKGTNGRWRGVLSEEQLAKYDALVASKLTPDCAAWLAGGNSAFNPNS